jgi:hypothetical protein
VEVIANQDSVLTIDWPIASVLTVTAAYAAFQFSSTAELALSGQAIGRFVSATMGAPGVILVEMAKGERGQMTATAALYSATRPTAIRSASAELVDSTRDNGDRLAALARFVALREVSRKITVNVVDQDPLEATGKRSPSAPAPPPASVTATPAPPSSGNDAPAAGRTGMLWSHPHVFQTLLIVGGIALTTWGVHMELASTRTVVTADGPETARNGVNKAGIALALLGMIPSTLGLWWIVSDQFGGTAGTNRPRPAEGNTALQLVPKNGGGTLTLSGRF